jgi:hypothetical protein
MTFSAKSAAERRLDRIHTDGTEPITSDDVVDEQVRTERVLAGFIADHPVITLSEGAILEACEFDLEELRANAEMLYPEFGADR